MVYLLNFYLCVPLLWFRHRFWLFSLANALLIVVFNFHLFNLFSESTNNLPVTYRAGFSSMLIIVLLVNLMAIAFAVSIRYIMRQSEKKQKEVEAELAWLKNQINPHFLFNTLNNISSLTQVDADEAQDAVMQLSDLLRYAMYETNKKKVPISGETVSERWCPSPIWRLPHCSSSRSWKMPSSTESTAARRPKSTLVSCRKTIR